MALSLSLSISLCIKYNQSGTHVCTNYVLPLLELPPYQGGGVYSSDDPGSWVVWSIDLLVWQTGIRGWARLRAIHVYRNICLSQCKWSYFALEFIHRNGFKKKIKSRKTKWNCEISVCWSFEVSDMILNSCFMIIEPQGSRKCKILYKFFSKGIKRLI